MTNIEKLVREAGSQQALASAIGVCQQAVGQWERKGYVPVSRIPIVVDKYPKIVTMLRIPIRGYEIGHMYRFQECHLSYESL